MLSIKGCSTEHLELSKRQITRLNHLHRPSELTIEFTSNRGLLIKPVCVADYNKWNEATVGRCI